MGYLDVRHVKEIRMCIEGFKKGKITIKKRS